MDPLGLRTAEASSDLDHVDILPRHWEVTTRASGAALSLPEVTGRAQRLPDQGGRLLNVQVGKNTHVSNFSSSLFLTNIIHFSHKINCLTLLIAKTFDKMSASRFLVHNKVHFLLRVNDLFLVNFVHIWGRRGVTPPQTLCSQDASLFAPPLSRFNERNADDDVDSPDSQRRMSEIGVKEGRESASFDWLLGPVGGLRGLHILTHFLCFIHKS